MHTNSICIVDRFLGQYYMYVCQYVIQFQQYCGLWILVKYRKYYVGSKNAVCI
jgi:hypothetical protein